MRGAPLNTGFNSGAIMKFPGKFPPHLAGETLKTLKGNVKAQFSLVSSKRLLLAPNQKPMRVFLRSLPRDLGHLSRTLKPK